MKETKIMVYSDMRLCSFAHRFLHNFGSSQPNCTMLYARRLCNRHMNVVRTSNLISREALLLSLAVCVS